MEEDPSGGAGVHAGGHTVVFLAARVGKTLSVGHIPGPAPPPVEEWVSAAGHSHLGGTLILVLPASPLLVASVGHTDGRISPSGEELAGQAWPPVEELPSVGLADLGWLLWEQVWAGQPLYGPHVGLADLGWLLWEQAWAGQALSVGHADLGWLLWEQAWAGQALSVALADLGWLLWEQVWAGPALSGSHVSGSRVAALGPSPPAWLAVGKWIWAAANCSVRPHR